MREIRTKRMRMYVMQAPPPINQSINHKTREVILYTVYCTLCQLHAASVKHRQKCPFPVGIKRYGDKFHASHFIIPLATKTANSGTYTQMI